VEAKDALNRIRADVGALMERGQQFVQIPALLQYLNDLEANAPAISQASQLQHQSQLAHHRAVHESQLEMFKSVLETGQTAVNTAILVSGGGTVALLAFVGNLMAKSAPVPFPLVVGILLFAVGVLCGAVAAGARYICQYCYGNNWLRSAIGFHIFCVALVLASYALFAAAVVAAYHGFIT
jgi:hypothetical protein